LHKESAWTVYDDLSEIYMNTLQTDNNVMANAFKNQTRPRER